MTRDAGSIEQPTVVNDDDGARDSATAGISRRKTQTLILAIATGIVIYLCYRLASPFLPALAWALALAVIAHPLHRNVAKRLPYPNLAAGVSATVVAIIVLFPAIFVTQRLVTEGENLVVAAQTEFDSGTWKKRLTASPILSRFIVWLSPQPETAPTRPGEDASHNSPQATDTDQRRAENAESAVAPVVRQAATAVTGGLTSFVTGTVWLGMQMFVTLMALFFFLRDRHLAMRTVRSLLPLSHDEADQIFSRIDDTITATVFGSLVVAFVQGCMGGVIFWWLELPSPLFWGAVMGVLAVIPVLGTFVIWMPTAIMLALQGDWTKAAILVTWGTLAIGLIDNLLYPFIVGKRMQFHTLVVFIAVVGGIAVFGASGIVLGPVVLAVADALLEIWRRRTANGRSVQQTPAV
jgi:predicted PurR-regulated permease PerM